VDQKNARVREFFSRFFRTEGLADDQDIFAGGYVNSLFAMQLIAWLEKEYRLTVDDADLQISNFSSIDAICAFIARKVPTAQAALRAVS
jgi:methoxymalonate biosynthesis acyl carrier protein